MDLIEDAAVTFWNVVLVVVQCFSVRGVHHCRTGRGPQCKILRVIMEDHAEKCRRNCRVEKLLHGVLRTARTPPSGPRLLNCRGSTPPSLIISRATLLQNKIVCAIKIHPVMKCLVMFAEIAGRKVYDLKYCEQFDKCLKLGIQEDMSGDEQLSLKQ